MAGALKTPDKQKLAKLTNEILELLANENGKIEASNLKDKYREYFKKTFKIPNDVSTLKLTAFLQTFMKDEVEITKKGTVNFIVAKSKKKEPVPVKQNVSRRNTEHGVSRAPANMDAFVPLMQNVTPHKNHSITREEFRQNNMRPAGMPVVSNDVNNTTIKIIKELAKENFVEVGMVKTRLYEHYKVRNARDLGFQRDDHIPALKDLIWKQREINAAIQAFVMVHSVSTLKELAQYLINLYSDAREFEDLNIGPLVKHPLIYQYFKFPMHLQEPPDITTLKVMKYLKQFMTDNKLWKDKVDLVKFMDYLTEQMSCTSPYQLGVKIESVALMIKSIRQCSFAQSNLRKDVEKKFMQEIAVEIEDQMQKHKRRLLGGNQLGFADPDALVNRLVDLSPVDILKKLFEYCMEFFQGKVLKQIEAFIQTCLTDKGCRKLFQLALHKACRELVKPVEDHTSHVGAMDNKVPHNELSAEEPTIQLSPPSLNELLKEVKSWLVKSTSMNTRLLASVEEHILGYFNGFQSFRDLGHGSFLKFLSENKDLQSLIYLPGHTAEDVLGTANKSDVIAVIQQCGVDSDKAKILKSICAQYRLDSGFDSALLDGLIEKSRHQARDSNLASQKIVYEACLVSESLETSQNETLRNTAKKNTRHGLLGYQDESKALQCLYQTPLLEDYASWSNWDHVFAPSYGNLKTFLKKVTQIPREDITTSCSDDLVAMETAGGCLLRVTRLTSVEKFLECAKDADVIGTAGHLVSLVLFYGGLEKAPLALLANSMKDALLSLSSSLESSTTENMNEFIMKFVIRCLKRIPNLMRVALAGQIFIEPLKFVFGNVVTPGLVLKFCKTHKEKSVIHGLGIRLGITEWQEDFQKKLVLSVKEVPKERRDARIVEEEQETLKKQSKTQYNDQESSESGLDKADKTLTIDEEEKGLDDQSEKSADNTLETDHPELLGEREQHCREVIESIRRDEFGIGVNIAPEHHDMIEKQRSREGRGLKRLSTELYSKDTHFVLELVQNADDNSYPEQSPSSHPPSIAFVVNTEKVVVFNNEIGFQEKNIRALCDVGKSTKGKQRYGYIGQKGIGFKSVFRITDTPEVHSNGYHVKFDAKSGHTGLICPHWCEPSDEDNSVEDWTRNWATRIVLTLKEEMKKAQKKTLIARFYDIQPSLLLFLRRLRQIKIIDEVLSDSREMVRRDLGDNLIELKHSSGVDLWFVVKRELPASNMKPEIETTEIALAFPVPTANSKISVSLEDIKTQISGKSLVQQPVFAFLPLRSYGFRFIVQADFDVPSSREDVDKDSAWNQWLRQEISRLFLQAFDDLKDHPYFDGVSSIVQFLQFIPLENEILDFFKPVTTVIHEGIRRKACVPCLAGKLLPNDDALRESDALLREEGIVESSEQPIGRDAGSSKEDNLSGSELKWVFPSQVVIAEDPLIQDLISVADLSRYLNKFYLHPDVQPFLNQALCRVLGIDSLSCRHLIDIGKAISGESSHVNHSLEDFSRWVAKWLCCVYRCLERERDCSEETLKNIASLSIFPLSDGQLTKLSGQPVFLPLEKSAVKGEQTSTKASKKAAEIIHKDLRSLHPMLLSSLDDIGRPQARKLLEQLQVKCLTSRDLIKHHIIPSLQSNQKQIEKSPEVLRSFIIYIEEQWDLDPTICDLEQLSTCALLKTNKGFVNPVTQPVHFTVEYGNDINLEKDFPSVPWTLLDNIYLGISRKTPSSWEKFFSSLGVVHFIAIERKDVCLSKSELSSSVWSSVSEFWPSASGDGRYTIKDYASSELEKLLSSDSSEKELGKLAEVLDRKWDDKYAKYTNVPYMDNQGKEIGQTYPSVFLLLKESSWIPSKCGTSKVDRRCPNEVFLYTEEVHQLLGGHSWYALPQLTNQKFLSALEIQTSVTFETLVEIFLKWVERSQLGDENTFDTSIEHMSNVYRFMEMQIIHNNEKRKMLEEATKDKPVTFVPLNPTPQNTRHTIVGEFVARKCIYWDDPSKMMQKPTLQSHLSAVTQPRRMLLNYYPPTLANFFVTFLKIDENPNVKEYVGLMDAIVSQSSMAGGIIVDEMMFVFDVVASKCRTENSVKDFVKIHLSSLKVFPTVQDKWVSLEEKPLFSDDKRLEKLFRHDDDSLSRKDEGNPAACSSERTREVVHFVKMGLQRRLKKTKDRNEEEEQNNDRITKNVRRFFKEVCGIRTLSECVSQDIISRLTSESRNLQLFLHKWVPYIQRYLYCKQPNHHESLQDQGMVERLANIRCYGAKTLEVVYRLSTHPLVNIPIKKNCGIDKKSDVLRIYVTDSDLRDAKDLTTELADYFAPPGGVGELSNFIISALAQKDNQIINFMDGQGLDILPEDVQVWYVPEPARVPEPVLEELVPETNTDFYPAEIPSDRRQEASEIDGEPRGLQSWPPKSSAIAPNEVAAVSKNPSTEQVLNMWPPPAPPEAYRVPEQQTGHQVITDSQKNKTMPEVQGLSNSDPTGFPPLPQHPLPSAAVQEGRDGAEEQPSNVETSTALPCGTRPPMVSPSEVNSPQRAHTRPLAVLNNEISVELEEVQFGSSIERTELIGLSSSANAEEIGKWGEDCVFKLLQKMAEGRQDLEVIWVNQENESGCPYDIILREQAGETTFIEVKSTSSSEKHVLEISSQEIKCAYNKKGSYHLYRVYNAGNPSAFRVSRLCNLAMNLDSKAVRLFIHI